LGDFLKKPSGHPVSDLKYIGVERSVFLNEARQKLGA
jgi:hypothetical protein